MKKGLWCSGALALLALAGCQTTPSHPAAVPPPRIGTPVQFIPSTQTVNLQYGSGPYPTLYDGTSSCTLITPMLQPAEPPVQAPVVREEAPGVVVEVPVQQAFVVDVPPPTVPATLTFELTLNSVFEDSSIAYDAVGLRNIQPYLYLPDGVRVPPIQVMLDPGLIDRPHGALRAYTRKVRLVFQNVPTSYILPPPPHPAQGVRLVLEGFGAMFYFEWPPVLPAEVRRPPIGQTETYQEIRQGGRKARAWAREQSHRFD